MYDFHYSQGAPQLPLDAWLARVARRARDCGTTVPEALESTARAVETCAYDAAALGHAREAARLIELAAELERLSATIDRV